MFKPGHTVFFFFYGETTGIEAAQADANISCGSLTVFCIFKVVSCLCRSKLLSLIWTNQQPTDLTMSKSLLEPH